jgi:hypothetical protein
LTTFSATDRGSYTLFVAFDVVKCFNPSSKTLNGSRREHRIHDTSLSDISVRVTYVKKHILNHKLKTNIDYLFLAKLNCYEIVALQHLEV